MTHGAYLDNYRKTTVNTASPLQLIVMLYDGALRFITAGKTAMQTGDRYQQNEMIQKSQRILSELMASLDMEQGGEIAANLFALYSYAYNELVTSNLTDSPEGLDRAFSVLEPLRDSWKELESNKTVIADVSTEELRVAS